MIRRFETYAFVPAADDPARRRVADILARAGDFIPEVLHSRVGWNAADSAADLVWEHAYESPAAYRRYMVHPYHADLIDRHILADSPERLVERARGAGLFGYHCDHDAFVLDSGARVVMLLRLAAGADPDAVARACSELADGAGALMTSFGANTMASRWFDAETTLPGPAPKWSHVWELGLPSLDPARRAADDVGRQLSASSAVDRASALVYLLEAPGAQAAT